MIGKKLIEIARKAIKTYFSNEAFEVSEFKERKGIFVTLYKENELRGCIGCVKAVDLNKGIIDIARASAFSDPRFNPIKEEELKDIRIEISLLTNPELLEGNYLKEIKIGRDGLIIENSWNSGLLLPQVFVECNVDAEGALCMVCEKANLMPNAWKERDSKVYKFNCKVYSEEKPEGNIKRRI